ncbi:MAG: ATP-binding protein [Deltaproteobacteria bacterium]|nr:ATP-binding protein [Deltaproteobacteria bacterium]
MNDNHSSKELAYRQRWLEPSFDAAIHGFPVVVLTGARQVGKSTLLQQAESVKSWRYITLDDYDIRRQADTDPQALWAGTDRIVIDEVQHSPRLLSAVKMAVDNKRSKVKFVLSGSANLLLMRRVSETLAGRAVYFTLYPMTVGETEGRPNADILNLLFKGEVPAEGRIKKESKEDHFKTIVRGFMPPLLSLTSSSSVARWWQGYIATYLERDLREISQIDSLVDFRKVMEALALRSGQMLNQTEVSRDTGISQPTIHRYINLLETTCLAERLPAFSVNRTKRLIKAPKFYWLDSGLASHLSGLFDYGSLHKSKEKGALFETFILHHLKALSEPLVPAARVYYWRTVTGREVDFVMEHGKRLLAIEIKLSSTPRYSDIEALRLFIQEYPETKLGILLCDGDEIRWMDKKVVALPWRLIAG